VGRAQSLAAGIGWVLVVPQPGVVAHQLIFGLAYGVTQLAGCRC
jgi:hypothetical protein